MKKLLSILGAMTLIGTTSTSVVACGGESPNPPSPDTRIDIENKITSPIALGKLSVNTKADFLAKLQDKLKTMSDLTTITTNDYDVYKGGTGSVAIQDSDITAGNFLNIKIVAKGNKFKGNKDNITTNYTQKDTRTDLKDLKQFLYVKDVVLHNLGDFIKKMVNEINKSQENYKFLSKDDIDILMADGITPLKKEDIVKNNRLIIVVSAKKESKNFYGFKSLQVKLIIKENKQDLQYYTQDKLFNDLYFTFNTIENYEQLNEQIINHWKHINKLASGYEIKYYDANDEKKEITKNKQTTDSFYFVIYAAKNDPNWAGNTRFFYYETN